MFLSASLAVALLAADDPTRLKLEPSKASITVSWLDTEDRIVGVITPGAPAAGEPVTVSVFVGSFDGPPFTGPVTMTLKPANQIGQGESATVVRAPGQRVWERRFTPEAPGDYLLELSFRTTHLKVVRGALAVGEARLPRWLAVAVGGGLIAAALAIGLWALFRSSRAADAPAPPPPPQAPP